MEGGLYSRMTKSSQLNKWLSKGRSTSLYNFKFSFFQKCFFHPISSWCTTTTECRWSANRHWHYRPAITMRCRCRWKRSVAATIDISEHLLCGVALPPPPPTCISNWSYSVWSKYNLHFSTASQGALRQDEVWRSVQVTVFRWQHHRLTGRLCDEQHFCANHSQMWLPTI